MKNARLLLIPTALFIFLIAGCYTQMYRPDMEPANRRQQATLYNRYDSTAIDTTLAPDTTDYYETYPDYGWNDWGRPRQGPIWGWDYNSYMPDYYWGYYGYDSYYGVPWWHNWYDPYYPYNPGGGGGPAEPPSKRGGRRSHDTSGGSYATPPASSGTSPAYATPPPAPSTPPQNGAAKTDDGKRSGKRGH